MMIDGETTSLVNKVESDTNNNISQQAIVTVTVISIVMKSIYTEYYKSNE